MQGMTKQEVENAIGKPLSVASGGSVWHYEGTIQKNNCLKYEGEKCIQYETEYHTAYFSFSPNGHLKFPGRKFGQPSDGGWLYENCFAEPFYSKYLKN